ncbi:MAG: DUF2087 domain-containing protein [Candidatus Latescibacteria bacterium]|nr:DUF2087 domain-containing protein [Candidatus Latescibacterota bacterium]
MNPSAEDAWLDALPLSQDDKKAIRHYTRQRRLHQIPAKRNKLQPVLRWIALAFAADVEYSEPQVNAILKQYHDDHTRLRRELVDCGFLRRERSGAKYWLTPADEAAGPVAG